MYNGIFIGLYTSHWPIYDRYCSRISYLGLCHTVYNHFCETGLVVTPFLPGDSLLFVAGAISALPDMPLEVNILALVLFLSAVLGDSCNYMIGHFLEINFSIIPIPVYLGKVIWKRHMNFIKIRRKDNHYCPFCTYSPYICSFCSRYGQNALLLFYGV